jgi:hypothetical protein
MTPVFQSKLYATDGILSVESCQYLEPMTDVQIIKMAKLRRQALK